MARRPSIRDEDILEAAREVFLAKGIRATTAEVADRARVSEGILFHRFKTKEGLFRAALNPQLAEPPEVRELVERVGKGTVADNLQDACVAQLAVMKVRMPLIMLSFSNPGPSGLPEHFERGEHPEPMLAKTLAAYVRGEVNLGRLRDVDGDVFAYTLVGGMIHYVMQGILRPDTMPLPSSALYIRGLVDLLLHGASPTPPPRR
ncbi:TetR/AcrR family transcriptional regulator [Hyalangium versicolor]|uniref:TetR/AcrR family transcriptional regulator n=1 Tax=Hyalangium versicolor TaxID=2861190 RepID=UPI001CCC2D1A|nr:TetR/AcrR family transcriptional regulator [Hyalangium versicolor]